MDGVGWSEGVIDSIEGVLLVSLVVKDGELGRIEEAASVEAVSFDEVAPVFAAESKIEAGGGRSEGAVGGIDAASRTRDSEARARGRDDDQAGFPTVLGRGSTAYDFDGLNGVGGDLVGEYFALLVGNRLAVDRKRVGGVVSKTVEETVGVSRDARSGGLDERTEAGSLALHWNLDEEVAVDIGVEGGVGFDEVAAGFHSDGLSCARNLQAQLEVDSDQRADLKVFVEHFESVGCDGESVGVERNVGESEMPLIIGNCAAVKATG